MENNKLKEAMEEKTRSGIDLSYQIGRIFTESKCGIIYNKDGNSLTIDFGKVVNHKDSSIDNFTFEVYQLALKYLTNGKDTNS